MSNLTIPSINMTAGSATGNPKNKVGLKKGRGLMDWVRLGHTNKDLAGTGGRIIKVTMEELAKHNKRDDAWIALYGKVYNITPYFEYHPGGEDELFRGVGIDATNMFNEEHKWVNYESLLQKCLIGPLVQSKCIFSKAKHLYSLMDKSVANAKSLPANNSLGIPSFSKISLSLPSPPAIGMINCKPKYDWFQTDSTINITIYTRWKYITQRHITVVCKEQELKIYVYIKEDIFVVNVELHKPVEKDVDVRIANTAGKIDVLVKKRQKNVHWVTLGNALPSDSQIIAVRDSTIDYYSYKITSKTKVTHDTYLFELQSEDLAHIGVPVGFHVFLGLPDIDTRRPYTPIIHPISEINNENYRTIKFLIKIYSDGILTPRINDLSWSNLIEVSIPQGSFSWTQQNQIEKLGNLLLLAAGTGITAFPPMISSALKNNILTKLMFFNKTEEDIVWKEEFQKLEELGTFTVTHVLSKPTDNWNGLKGRVRKEILQDVVDNSKAFVCVCGPRQFNELCTTLLQDIGVPENNVHSFVG